jgi:hypothetical protein
MLFKILESHSGESENDRLPGCDRSLPKLYYTLKMEAVRSCETSVTICETALRHSSE